MIKQRPYPMGGGLCTLLGLIVLLAACGGDPAPTAAPTAEPGGGIEVPPAEDEAVIDQAEVVLLDGFPVEANVEVRGTLPDACMPITQAAQAPIDAQTIGLGIFVTRDETVACTGEPLPFEETYALDIDGLPAGTYTVDVNGTLATFTLEEDNVRPNPGAICPQPSGSIVAAINPEAGYCLLHPGEAVVSAPAPGLQRIAVPEGPTLTITVLGPTDALPTGEPAIIGGQDAVLSEEEGERRAVAIYEGTGYAIALAPVDAALWDLVTASFTSVRRCISVVVRTRSVSYTHL
ncbi:MAG: hypothetical protein GYB64_18220, partial [Chloroflexi bacterium]|nr:hypothetical protein [Chloroflexota bacterium]